LETLDRVKWKRYKKEFYMTLKKGGEEGILHSRGQEGGVFREKEEESSFRGISLSQHRYREDSWT